ncbi:MAG: hypothetical protein ACR2PG_12140, partial [Hyphomicrobiaceae bacterium]
QDSGGATDGISQQEAENQRDKGVYHEYVAARKNDHTDDANDGTLRNSIDQWLDEIAPTAPSRRLLTISLRESSLNITRVHSCRLSPTLQANLHSFAAGSHATAL